MWSMKREMWIWGPNLPKGFFVYGGGYAISIDLTTTLIFGLASSRNHVTLSHVFAFNFESLSWKKCADIPKILPGYLRHDYMTCSAIISKIQEM